MNKLSFALLAAFTVGMASAQSIYAPTRSVQDQGISLKGWGSGTISQTEEMALDGVFSLRVSTRNYFQGGSVNFAKAVDMAAKEADKSNLIQFSIRVADAGATLGGGAPGGGGAGITRGGAGGAGVGGGGGVSAGVGAQRGGDKDGDRGAGAPPQGGGRGSFGAAPGSGGAGTTGATLTASDVPLKQVRVIVTTSDGLKSEAFLSLNATSSKTNWVPVSMPLSAIKGFSRTNKQITGLAFSGDATATFYIGDIKVLNDTTPIQGEMNHKDPLNLALNDEVEFIGSGFGGASQLKYFWDFDSKDGIQEDAEGQFVKRKFRKPGTYTVTLTIADAFGAKAPLTRTVVVTVNP